jgi:hypothetical protein
MIHAILPHMTLVHSRKAGIAWLLALPFVGLQSHSAYACGGLFCNASAPVNQTAERILFAADGKTTTQIVEIRYEGPSERFAWVLPVPGKPKIGVSSTVVLDRLQAATNPNYQLQTTTDCNRGFFPSLGASNESADDGGDFSDGGVTVIDHGTVGPFDYETLSVDAGDDDAALVALRWLEANEYDVGGLGADVLRPYLQNGLNLLAVRLTKGADTGSIRPLSLEFEGVTPSIPIRPTAVAANDDMGVMVWILGESRAVPTNYLGLELNELYIDWHNPGLTYDLVVSEAADEAGGQGFVTEFAGSAATFASTIEPGYPIFDSETLLISPTEDVLRDLVNSFGGYDGFEKVLSDHVEFRGALTARDFLNCSYCYFGSGSLSGVDYGTYNAATDPIGKTDNKALLAAFQQEVIQPISDAANLFRAFPYLTRFYTTMSAGEMTLDPVFDFNPDLADVSNVHVGQQYVGCDGVNGQWRVELPDGRVVQGTGLAWPFTPAGNPDMPVTLRQLEFSTSGAPLVKRDNSARIDAAFDNSPANGSGGFGLGCSVSASEGPSRRVGLGFFGLALAATAGAVAWARRPRRA